MTVAALAETQQKHTHHHTNTRLTARFPKQVFIGQFTESAVVTIPKKNRPKSPEKKTKEKKTKNFYTFYKVSMLISPSSSSKTNVRTTLGLGPMQNPPKGPGGVARREVTSQEQCHSR